MIQRRPRAWRRIGSALLTSAICAAIAQVTTAAHDKEPAPHTSGAARVAKAPAPADAVRKKYLAVPIRFERSGQPGGQFDFFARGAGYNLALSRATARIVLSTPPSPAGRNGSALEVRSTNIDLHLLGARASAAGIALDPLPGLTNHLIGSDPRGWRTRVGGFGRVKYEQVYPGVDVVYYGNQRQLEYDFLVAPGADYRAIALSFAGATGLSIDEHGNLVVATAIGDLVQHAPVIYQERAGARQPVAGGYVLRGDEVGFWVGGYDRRRPLVIDPVLSYSTYLGGAGTDHGLAVAVDGAGEIYVAGFTTSTSFPQAPGPFGGGVDAFVTRLNAQGTAIVYSTYIGGVQTDYASDLEVDANGNAYIAGMTESQNFPTLNAVQPALNGYSDSFVTKLDPAGALVYSTYLGGRNSDLGYGLAVDGSGRAYVTGWTGSPDFPLVNPLQASTGGSPAWLTTDGGTTWNAIEDGLATIWVLSIAIDPGDPNTVYAGTYQDGVFKSSNGGQSWTAINDGMFPVPVNAMAIDPAVSIVYAATDFGVFASVDGGLHWTMPNQFFGSVTSLVVDPTAPGTVYAGIAQGFSAPGVMKSTDGGQSWASTGFPIDVLSLAISPVAPATVYAGTTHGVYGFSETIGWEPVSSGLPHTIRVEGLAIDPAAGSTLYAATELGLFRTTADGAGAWAPWSPVASLSGIPVFRIAVAPSAPSVLYASSYTGVARSVDSGATWSGAGLPDTAAYALAVHPGQPSTVYVGTGVSQDAFVVRLNAAGSAIEYSTFLGGSAFDYGSDIAVDTAGDAYLVGATQSRDFPVLNPARPGFSGVQDLFVAKIASSGALEYATYLGGSLWEDGATIGVDANGNAHVAAYTLSHDFPVVNAHQPNYGGGQADMIVTRLDRTGSTFLYSTYLGGSALDHFGFASLVRIASPAIAVSPAGEAFVAGTTSSIDFPTANPFQPAHAGGGNDAFVAKYDAGGALEYSTYLGGSGADSARRIAVDADGSVVVAGLTSSTNFPTVNPLQAAKAGDDDVFVARITASTPDVQRPTTTFQLSGTEGLAGWYRSPATVTLSATADPASGGIRFIDYSVNGGPFQHYSGPFTISAQGTTRIDARATTVSGAVESPAASISVNIDSVGPGLTIDAPQPRDYLHSEALTLNFSAADATSGVAPGNPTGTIDGQAVSSGDVVSLLTLPLGPHTFAAAASDIAGNGSQQTVTFRVIATLDSLIATVNQLIPQGGIDPQTSNGLLAKLNEAKAALDQGRLNVVRNKLSDLVDQINSQTGKGITADAAALLIEDVQYVLGTI